MMTCDPSISVIDAPARSAMDRTTSAPAAVSPVATTLDDGRFFHPGTPEGSERELGNGTLGRSHHGRLRRWRWAANASWNCSDR